MNDTEFLHSLEDCTLPSSAFDHCAHVRAAYLYLRAYEFPVALERMRRTIKNYAAYLGKPLLYHETMTVAYMSLIQQHRHERGDLSDWSGFARDNPELLLRNLLRQFYSEAELKSETARSIFVLPRHSSISVVSRRV